MAAGIGAAETELKDVHRVVLGIGLHHHAGVFGGASGDLGEAPLLTEQQQAGREERRQHGGVTVGLGRNTQWDVAAVAPDGAPFNQTAQGFGMVDYEAIWEKDVHEMTVRIITSAVVFFLILETVPRITFRPSLLPR